MAIHPWVPKRCDGTSQSGCFLPLLYFVEALRSGGGQHSFEPRKTEDQEGTPTYLSCAWL